MDRQTDGRTDRQTDGWMDRQMDVWLDGQTDGQIGLLSRVYTTIKQWQ